MVIQVCAKYYYIRYHPNRIDQSNIQIKFEQKGLHIKFTDVKLFALHLAGTLYRIKLFQHKQVLPSKLTRKKKHFF